MKKWLSHVSILSLVALASLPAWALGKAEIASSDPLAPRIILPAWTPTALPEGVDPWVQNIVKARVAAEMTSGDALLESVAMQMLDRYDVSDMSEEEQTQRFLSIATGDAASDYEKSQISMDAVRFSRESFDGFAEEIAAPEAPPDTGDDKAKTDAAFLEFLASPDGMKTLSMMSGDQISAIAALVSAMRSDLPPEQLFGTPASAMEGVPELSQDPSGTDVASLVKSMTEAGAMPEPETRDVGDGRNLLLAGWVSRVGVDGTVEIVNPTIEGSALPVMEGMVLGPFGPVAALQETASGVQVVFANGERIGPEGPVLDEGVPALSGSETAQGDAPSGEFILSALPDMPAGTPVPVEAETVAPVTADIAAAVEGGLETSLRPRPRPADLEEKAAPVAEGGLDRSPRPLPRPKTLVLAEVAPKPADGGLTTSLRPKPRPDSLVARNGGS